MPRACCGSLIGTAMMDGRINHDRNPSDSSPVITRNTPPSGFRPRLANGIVLTLATGAGVGYSPKAPGTIGSLWGLALVWGMQSAGVNGVGWAAVTLVVVLGGVPLCAKAANLIGRKDPGCVVWDELAAFPIVFAVTPLDEITAPLGFLLFRLFDIAKPWPIRRFERLPGGWGIMADDLIAGLFAATGLWLAMRFVLT